MKQSNLFPKSEMKDKNNTISETHLNSMRSRDYSSSFDEVGSWIYKTGIRLQNKKNEKGLQKMKNFFYNNKLRFVYAVIILALVTAACNMPVTQTENAGYMFAWTVPAENTAAQEKVLLLPWLKGAQMTMNENYTNGKTELLYTAILPGIAENQAESYRKELEAISGINTLKFTPLDYDIKRPLYSAALHSFFKIEIDATGMSDEELEAEVKRKMSEQGIDMNIRFSTSPEGRRDIFIEKSGIENSNKEPKQFELNIDDNNGREKIKLMEKKADPEKFKGKTDEQIRAIIKEDMKNPELKDDDIKITREGDNIKVNVQADIKEIK